MYKLSNKNRLHEGTKPHWTEANLYMHLAESVSCTAASVCHQKPPPAASPCYRACPTKRVEVRSERRNLDNGEKFYCGGYKLLRDFERR